MKGIIYVSAIALICHTILKLIFDHDALLFFCVFLYTHNFGIMHPFSKRTIQQRYQATYIIFINCLENNRIKTDFIEIPTISRSVLKYFCESL